jgi:hypothetical protein
MGYCIVRAELQGERVLITLSSTTDVTHTWHPTYSAPQRHFLDIEEAAEAVAEFLREFTTRVHRHDA